MLPVLIAASYNQKKKNVWTVFELNFKTKNISN